jgi:biopolymer transport protein ExbB
VAALCLHALEQGGRPAAEVERSLQSHGAVLTSQLERGCSWIKLFIAMAPSLGFLGTVIGMVMAFDQIQQSNDFGASTVAAGMKVALITTIFGIIVALVLQLFYNYILTRIDALVDDMEVASEEMLSIES